MKKGNEYIGTVREIKFPNKGIVEVTEEDGTVSECTVKGTVAGQKIKFRVNKKKAGMCEGYLMEVLEKSPDETEPSCPHFGICGGCTYLNLDYDKQLELKKNQVFSLIEPLYKNMSKRPDIDSDRLCKLEDVFEGIKPSPVHAEYRNKMEFSFGDACKGGDLELGLHKKGGFYDIVSVTKCNIVDEDYRKILSETLSYFRGKETPYYHKLNHEGYLRHLLIRKAVKTGEILVDLVTTSKEPAPTMCTEISLIEDWKNAILSLKLDGKIAGILNTINDSLADTVQSDRTDILYGQDYFYEELLGLRFKITPFSFFQTNSLSAEVLYDTAREFIRSTNYLGDENKQVVYDLYSGTGTIAQLMSDVSGKVIGVEIVEEAVEAAKENAKLNGLENCDFIAGDVLKVIDDIEEKPDFIILDPPRDGVHPKALKKIIDYGVPYILYISCKPTSLVRDLEMLIPCGYYPKRIVAVDQFPNTVHVETVVLLSKKHVNPKAYVEIGVDAEEYYKIKGE